MILLTFYSVIFAIESIIYAIYLYEERYQSHKHGTRTINDCSYGFTGEHAAGPSPLAPWAAENQSPAAGLVASLHVIVLHFL